MLGLLRFLYNFLNPFSREQKAKQSLAHRRFRSVSFYPSPIAHCPLPMRLYCFTYYVFLLGLFTCVWYVVNGRLSSCHRRPPLYFIREMEITGLASTYCMDDIRVQFVADHFGSARCGSSICRHCLNTNSPSCFICKISFVIAIKILFAADGFNENVRKIDCRQKGFIALPAHRPALPINIIYTCQFGRCPEM